MTTDIVESNLLWEGGKAIVVGDIAVTDAEAREMTARQLTNHVVRRTLKNMARALDEHQLMAVTGWPEMAEKRDDLTQTTHYHWKMELDVP